MTIPPELFEQLYLSPKNRVKGDLRQTVGNPTPIGKLQCTCEVVLLKRNKFSDVSYLSFGGLLVMYYSRLNGPSRMAGSWWPWSWS
jgi:hypothetical protein